MKKEFVLLFLLGFLFSCMIPFSSSTIFIEDNFKKVYNIGDKLNADFSIKRESQTKGYIDVYLDCDDSKFSVGLKYIEISSGESKNFSFYFPANTKGDCVLVVELFRYVGERKTETIETERSSEFEISDNINIDYNLNKAVFSPGDKIKINGSAIKENKNNLEGYISISSEGFFDKTIEVNNGEFFLNHSIDNDVSPGVYDIDFHAFQKNQEEEIINKGRQETEVRIKSIPSSIGIITNKSVKPPANLSIGIKIYDQGNNTLENKSALVRLFNKQGDIVFEDNYKSGSFFNYNLESDAEQGFWMIKAYHGSVFSEQPIDILENPQLKETILPEESQIIVKNIGNVRYSGPYDIFLKNNTGNITLHKNIDLDIGEEISFEIKQKGLYNITLEENSFSDVSLTGAAVAADINSENSFFILIVLLVIIAGFFMYVKREFFKRFFKREDKKKNGKAIKEEDFKKNPGKKGFLFKNKREVKNKHREKNNKNQQRDFLKQKKIHMAFFNIGDLDKKIDLESFANKYRFSLKKMKEGVYFILSYSHLNERSDEKIVDLAKEIKTKAKSLKKEVSIIINADDFNNKASFLKEFSLETKKILDSIDKGIFVSEKAYKNIGRVSRQAGSVVVMGKKINLYKIN